MKKASPAPDLNQACLLNPPKAGEKLKRIVMIQNIGSIDRALRVIVGLAVLSLVFILEGNARWFGLIGAVPVFTALVGWCPIYSVLGIGKR